MVSRSTPPSAAGDTATEGAADQSASAIQHPLTVMSRPTRKPHDRGVGSARVAAPIAVALMAGAWGAGFAWLALVRHLAGGSHAEDLGFTDQVLANFLRGQWFRMSIYQGATWNTELDL